jgi:thiol-disulfide isomerase/thioredoxin
MENKVKKIFFICLIIVSAMSAQIFFAFAEQGGSDVKVVAYYFHGTMRCPTCHKLEQYSKEVIEANFKNALDLGNLEFKVVNVEDKGNEHYVNDYQLYTKMLVLSLVRDSKEVRSKNLVKIWEYVGNKQKFFDYVKSEVTDFLKETQ